ARDASRRPVARGAGCSQRSRGHTARRRGRWRSPFSYGCRGSSPSRKRLTHPTCSTTQRPERSSSRTTTWCDSKRPFRVAGRERVDGEAAVAAGARPEDEHRVDEALVAEPEVEALEHPGRVREVLRIAVEVVEEQKPVPRVHLLAEVAGPVDMGEGHRADAVA